MTCCVPVRNSAPEAERRCAAIPDVCVRSISPMTIPFLITARLSSVRLPKKLLRELDGTEVVSKVIERGIAGFGREQVILCTSPLATDDELVEVAQRHGIGVHRGHPIDILDRLAGACRSVGAAGFVGQTGENPIFSVEHCLRIRDAIAAGRDLVRFNDLPIGCSPYGISRAAIETLLELKEEEDTGFWGYLLNRPEVFDVEFMAPDDDDRMPGIRLTVDHPEDLELMRAIFTELPGMPAVRDVVALLRRRPELLGINAHRVQLDMPEEDKARINAFFARRADALRDRLAHHRRTTW